MLPKLNTEIYLIPEDGNYLAYAPLRRLIMRLRPEQVNILARLKEGRPLDTDVDCTLAMFLRQVGVIDGKPEEQPQAFVDNSFAPVRTTLFLSNQCNLACRYCYAGGQTREMLLDEQIGRAAIDLASENCRKRSQKILNIGFHGGGEPTMAWALMVGLTAYAKEKAEKNGQEVRLGMSTNGAFGEDQAMWIARNMNYISVSFDGPPAIQDHFRPFKDGSPTSSIVLNALRVFDREKFPYSFQSTISDTIVHEMPAIIRYFAENTHPQFVKFEPVSDCGRFFGMPDRIPPGKEFAKHFNRAFDVAQELGLKLTFSGIRLWGSGVSYFCGAFAEPFAVTPDGCVSACYEAYSADSPYAGVFVFGHWNKATRSFDLDLEKLRRLRSRNIYTLEPCSRCFCKYSCGGDCATRNFRRTGTTDLMVVGARCDAIREITKFRLARYLNSAAERQRRASETGGKTEHEQDK